MASNATLAYLQHISQLFFVRLTLGMEVLLFMVSTTGHSVMTYKQFEMSL